MKTRKLTFGFSLKSALAIALGLTLHANAQTYDVAYNAINFGGAGVTITNKVGTGTAVNNIVLYQNVITISGQQIDAIVRTQEISNATISTFDQAGTGTGYTNNLATYFSPQFTIGSGGGYAVFKIQFILGGSYNNTTNTGTVVTLQNVRLNTYDIDGNGTSGTNQYNEFGGFATSELGNPTNLTMTYNSTLGLTKFRSTPSANTTDATDVKNRVRVNYSFMSEFTTKVGAEGSGAAYFFLDFSAGSTFTTAVSYSAPSLDLNTSTSGLDNEVLMVPPATKNFSSGTSNIVYTGSTLDNLKVIFNTAQTVDGSAETLIVNGATSGGTIALNFTNAQAIPNVVLGGVTYAVTATVSGGKSTLVFTKSGGGTLTIAQVETLVDALQYRNALTSATEGWKYFNVTTLSASFETAVAQFRVNIDIPLPTELISFSAQCDTDHTTVSWQTATEHNSAGFVLERSENGQEWDEVATVSSVGNSTTKVDYSYDDYAAIRFEGYYRLTQMDNDGQQKVYDPILVNCNAVNDEVDIYPNPTAGDFTVAFHSSKAGSATIKVINANNAVLNSLSVNVNNGGNQVIVSGTDLSSGVYFVHIEVNNQIVVKKLMVN